MIHVFVPAKHVENEWQRHVADVVLKINTKKLMPLLDLEEDQEQSSLLMQKADPEAVPDLTILTVC